MLYLFDEYCKELANTYGTKAPSYKTYVSNFADCDKNLHEMSVSEINDEISKWNPIGENTKRTVRFNIKKYLTWLQEKDVDLDINVEIVKDIVFPNYIQDEEQITIYSSDDLHNVWNLLYKGAENYAVQNVTTFEKESLLCCYATSILAFYGLNQKQIFNLALGDIQDNKVADYNLPLTKQDNDILMQYKKLSYLSNGRNLVGYRYVRFSKYEQTQDVDSMISNIRKTLSNSRSKMTDETKQFTKYVTLSKVFTLGLFDRIYRDEHNHNERADRRVMPQWLQHSLMASFDGGFVGSMALDNKRNEYLEYRKQRMDNESNTISDTKSDITIPSQHIMCDSRSCSGFYTQPDALIKLIDRIDSALNNLDSLRNELLYLKNQLSEMKHDVDTATEKKAFN